jgi:tetratricopeptide (TPR) repeat protein
MMVKMLIVILLCVHVVKAQTIKGIVTLQNSGGKALPHVNVSIVNLNPDVTGLDGKFRINADSKMPGDAIEIKAFRSGYEVVNTSDLKTHVPSNPEEIVKIYMCKLGYRDSLALVYYKIGQKRINEEYNPIITRLKKEGSRNRLVIDSLVNQRRSDEAELKALSDKLATINFDEESKASKMAVEYFQKGEILKAIEALNTTDLERRLKFVNSELASADELDNIAKRKKENAQKEKKRIASDWVFKARLFRIQGEIIQAKESYQEALKVESNPSIGFEGGSFLIEINQNSEAINFFESTVDKVYDSAERAGFYSQLALAYNNIWSFDNGIINSKLALNIEKGLEQTNCSCYDTFLVLTTKMNLANAYLKINKVDSAEAELSEMLMTLQGIDEKQTYPLRVLLAQTFENLAVNKSLKGDFNTAEVYFRKSLNQYTGMNHFLLNDFRMKISTYLDYGFSQIQSGNERMADSLSQLAKKLIDTASLYANRQLFTSQIVGQLFLQGRLCEVQEDLKCSELSYINALNEIMMSKDSLQYTDHKCRAYFNLGLINNNLNNFLQSEFYFKKSIQCRESLSASALDGTRFEYGQTFFCLGRLYFSFSKKELSITNLKRAIEELQKVNNPYDFRWKNELEAAKEMLDILSKKE